MDAASVIRSAPPVLERGGDLKATYSLDEGLIAVQGGSPGPAIATFEGGDLVVAPIASASGLDEAERIGPVYREQGGGLAVPTGRVLVRFPPEDAPQAHSDALADAGFELDEVLSYAPHAAWVRPLGGDSVAALSGVEKLRSVPGVEHVEPQVLTEAAPRTTDA